MEYVVADGPGIQQLIHTLLHQPHARNVSVLTANMFLEAVLSFFDF